MSTSVDSGGFTVSSDLNQAGATYSVYLWAKGESENPLIKCGSYTNIGDAVSVGFTPRWVLLKTLSVVGEWRIIDQTLGGNVALSANTLSAMNGTEIIPSGWTPGDYGASQQIAYIAIQ